MPPKENENPDEAVRATLAHELNQPLTAIMNYVEAARQLLLQLPTPPARAIELLEKAVAQAERAGTVVRRLRNKD